MKLSAIQQRNLRRLYTSEARGTARIHLSTRQADALERHGLDCALTSEGRRIACEL